MPRRKAILTQRELALRLKAIKQAGFTVLEVRPDGTLIVGEKPDNAASGPSPLEMWIAEHGDFSGPAQS